MGKLDDIRALGQPEISRQYVKSGGTIATPAEVAAWKSRETGELQNLKRTIAEQAVEITRLKAELASRPVTENVTVASDRKSTVTNVTKRDGKALTQADRARMYRERKKAAGK